MTRWLLVPALLWAIGQDDPAPPPEDPQICTKQNKCKKSETKEKKECPDCGKRRIQADYAYCTTCARKRDVCSRCGLGETPGAAGGGGRRAKDIDEAASFIRADDLRELLSFIAGDELEGRCAGYPGNDKATERYAEIYKRAGLKPGSGDGYFQPVQVGGKASRNTIAVLEGTDLKSEYIFIGGHHDHVGMAGAGPPRQQIGGAQGGDKIWNGADDNGSGSTSVVTIARVLAESGLRPRRTIVFMTFTGEEWGMVGSKHYCRNLIFPKDQTIAMINVDMIGRMNAANDLNVYGLGTEDGNEWEALADRLGGKLGLKIKQIQGTRIGGGDSDHSSFRDIGIPDMFLMEGGPMQPDYHRVTDEVEKINFAGMERTARFALLLVWELANTDKRWKFKQA